MKWGRVWRVVKTAAQVGMVVGKTKPAEQAKVKQILEGIDKVIEAGRVPDTAPREHTDGRHPV